MNGTVRRDLAPEEVQDDRHGDGRQTCEEDRREKPHDYKVLPRVPSHPSSVASRGALVFAS